MDGVDRQRGGSGVSGGALPGRGMHDVCASRDARRRRAYSNTGLDGGNELQLSRAGGGCGREPERVLRDGDRDDAGGAPPAITFIQITSAVPQTPQATVTVTYARRRPPAI